MPPAPPSPSLSILPTLSSLITQTIKHTLLIVLAMALTLAILTAIASLHVAPWRGWPWAITNLLAAASLLTIASLILGVPLAINLAAARTVERHQLATQLLDAATRRDNSQAAPAPAAPPTLQRTLAEEVARLESQLVSTSHRPWHRLRAWLTRRSFRWLLADLTPILERTPIEPNASTADWLRFSGPLIDHTLATNARRTALRLALLWGCTAIAAIAATITLTHWP